MSLAVCLLLHFSSAPSWLQNTLSLISLLLFHAVALMASSNVVCGASCGAACVVLGSPWDVVATQLAPSSPVPAPGPPGRGTSHSSILQSPANFLRMSLTKSLLSAFRGDWFLGILDKYCCHFVASCQSIAFSGSLVCNSRCGACRQLIDKVFLLVWEPSNVPHSAPCRPLGTSSCIVSGALIDNWAW